MYQQMCALIFGLLSSASTITTTSWNQWAVSGPSSGGVLGPIWAYKYLFGQCMQYQSGQFQCQEQNSQFLLSGFQISLQALMIIASFLATAPCVSILLGMKCTRIFEDSPNLKRKLILASGVSYLIAAIATVSAVTWFTVVVRNEFFTSTDNIIRWELGACVYLGYISSIFSILSFLACICFLESDEEKNSRRSFIQSSTVLKEVSPKENLLETQRTHRYTDYV